MQFSHLGAIFNTAYFIIHCVCHTATYIYWSLRKMSNISSIVFFCGYHSSSIPTTFSLAETSEACILGLCVDIKTLAVKDRGPHVWFWYLKFPWHAEPWVQCPQWWLEQWQLGEWLYHSGELNDFPFVSLMGSDSWVLCV